MHLPKNREPGQIEACETSQIVDPEESDRFSIDIVVKLGFGVLVVWKMKPILKIKYGNIKDEELELWLPFKLSG